MDTTSPSVNTPLAEQPKKKGHGLLITIIALIILGAAGGGYYYWTQQNAQDAEAQSYALLTDNETLADYEAFLAQYPNSPYREEVQQRYDDLQKMYATWRDIVVGGHQRDFEMFKRNFPTSILARQCDIKIDSLDWVDASTEGTMESVQNYIDNHPEGRYVSDAIIVKERIQGSTASANEKMLIDDVIREFYDAFGANDPARVFQCITPTMTQFLSKQNATKADVAGIIERTYTTHILSCKFIVNNDLTIKKTTDNEGQATYTANFSVDQHISRDDEGKTFGSYTVEAIINAQNQISSLKMTEVSRR